MSVLDDLFYAIDTPGAYARGALSGRIGQRASGEDVLRAWGVNNPNKWAGIGAEMLLDPINLIPGGLGLKALRGAKKATQANKAARIMIKKGAMPAELAATTKVGVGGKPTRVFHGTQSTFKNIDESKFDTGALYGPGYYTTDSAEVASGYAKTKSWSPGLDDYASPEELKKYYAPGRELRSRPTNYLVPIRMDEKPYAKVVRYDSQKRIVHAIDAKGVKQSFPVDTGYGAITKGDFIREFGPHPAPQIRAGFMHSKKMFDLTEAAIFEDVGSIGRAAKDIGFDDMVSEFPEAIWKIKHNFSTQGSQLFNDTVYRKLDQFVTDRLPSVSNKNLNEIMKNAGLHSIDVNEVGIEEVVTPIVTEILKRAGFDTIKHTGGAITGNTEHIVHIGLKGASQMYLPHVAPAIKRVPKPRIGLLAAGTAGYQAGTKIGLRP